MAAGKWNMQKASGGVASITVADGVGATNIVLPESGTVATLSNIVGFKNYIINGNFDVWQRGTTIIDVVQGSFLADRFMLNVNGNATVSVVKSTEDTLNGRRINTLSLSVSTIGTTSYLGITTRLEDMMKYAGKTLTLSFYAISDSSAPIHVCYGRYYTSMVYSSAIIVGNCNTVSLTKYTTTFTIPPYAGESYSSVNSFLEIIIRQHRTTIGSLRIAQVQLEEGSVATPFEQIPIGLELSLCQRYYQVYGDSTQGINITGYSIAGQTERTSFMFPIQMRDNPNVTRVGTWYAGNCSQPTIAAKSKNGFSLQTIVAATGGFEYTCNGTGQYLIFEKEL